jgi:hypothetical protein
LVDKIGGAEEVYPMNQKRFACLSLTGVLSGLLALGG